jgi:hypothetical protein
MIVDTRSEIGETVNDYRHPEWRQQEAWVQSVFAVWFQQLAHADIADSVVFCQFDSCTLFAGQHSSESYSDRQIKTDSIKDFLIKLIAS